MTLLLDLPEAARKSGLKVIELDGWEDNFSAGGFEPKGVAIHHTGGFDQIGDTSDDLSYAKWMAFEGRPPTVPPPLDNLALSAEGVVYVSCSGNANHAGQARASGPMPAASDGNVIYIGIEAMNSGFQGWDSRAFLADGTEITYREAYVRLCAALCLHYGWDASHVRAHWEISVTGKWDPGDPDGIPYQGQRVMDMDEFRADVARMMEQLEDDMYTETDRARDKKMASQTERILRRVNQSAARERAILREEFGATEEQLDRVARKIETVRAELAEHDEPE